MPSRAVRRPRSARPTIADRMAAIDPRLLRLLDLIWLITLGRGFGMAMYLGDPSAGPVTVVITAMCTTMPVVGWLLLRWRPHLLWLIIFLVGAVLRTALMDHLMGVLGIALMLLLGGVRWGAVHLVAYLTLELGSTWVTGSDDGSLVYLLSNLTLRVAIQYAIGVVLWRCQVRVQRLDADRAALGERRDELLANASMRADLWLLAGRGRAAAALHDGLGQQLALVGMLLDYAARTGPDSPDGRREMAHSRLVLRDAAGNVGGWLSGAGGPHQRGLASWLELAAAYQGTPMEVTLDLPDESAELDAEQADYVARFLAESLTNAWRHGRATRVRASARLSAGELLLEVTDNGTASPSGGSGFGLRGLGADAAALGGRFSAGPAGTGWVNAARIPASRAPLARRRVRSRSDGRTLPAWSRDPTLIRFMDCMVAFSLLEGLVQLIPHNVELTTRMQGIFVVPMPLWLGFLTLVALSWLALRLFQTKVTLAAFLVLTFLALAVGQAPIFWLGGVLVFALVPTRRAWWFAVAALVTIVVVRLLGFPSTTLEIPLWLITYLGYAIAAGVLGMGIRYLLDIGERLETSNQELLTANSDLEQAHQLEVDLAAATERAAVAERLYGSIGRRLDETADLLVEVEAGTGSATLAREQVALLLADVRLWARALSPLRPESTWRDLQGIAGRFRGTGVSVRVDLPDTEPGLRPEVSVALVRLVQETLASAIHDRGAHAVEIDVVLDADQLLVGITDDGSQPDADALADVARRLEALGGSLATRQTSTARRLRVSLPLDAELNAAQPA